MENFKITTTIKDSVYTGTKLNANQDHITHNLAVFNEIVINDAIRLNVEYQTAMYYEHNDVTKPTNELCVYSDHSHQIIRVLDGLEDDDFSISRQNGQIDDALIIIQELCSVINSIDKLEQLYNALQANRPNYRDFLVINDISDNIDDYRLNDYNETERYDHETKCWMYYDCNELAWVEC